MPFAKSIQTYTLDFRIRKSILHKYKYLDHEIKIARDNQTTTLQ